MSEDNSWVFDSLVCFLHGPVWNAPLQTFIEEKSLLFDPNQELQPDNDQILEIHNDYKNLVDYMLGSFMEELHITPEQFEMACLMNGGGGGGGGGVGQQPSSSSPSSSGEGNAFQFHRGLFQQIWAANDVKMFIRMMTQRNVELQLQALDLIEKNQLGGGGESMAEETEQTGILPPVEVDELSACTDRERPLSPDAAVTPELEELPNDSPPALEEVAEKLDRLNLFFEKNQVAPEELIHRQKYLRQQRDRIVEIKRKTRVQQLAESMALDPPPPAPSSGKEEVASTTSGPGDDGQRRPTSAAQAARQLLDPGVPGQSFSQLLQQPEEQAALNSALQVRKTLAKRLKTEVVEQQS